jgi:hypothetical protein
LRRFHRGCGGIGSHTRDTAADPAIELIGNFHACQLEDVGRGLEPGIAAREWHVPAERLGRELEHVGY